MVDILKVENTKKVTTGLRVTRVQRAHTGITGIRKVIEVIKAKISTRDITAQMLGSPRATSKAANTTEVNSTAAKGQNMQSTGRKVATKRVIQPKDFTIRIIRMSIVSRKNSTMTTTQVDTTRNMDNMVLIMLIMAVRNTTESTTMGTGKKTTTGNMATIKRDTMMISTRDIKVITGNKGTMGTILTMGKREIIILNPLTVAAEVMEEAAMAAADMEAEVTEKVMAVVVVVVGMDIRAMEVEVEEDTKVMVVEAVAAEATAKVMAEATNNSTYSSGREENTCLHRRQRNS